MPEDDRKDWELNFFFFFIFILPILLTWRSRSSESPNNIKFSSWLVFFSLFFSPSRRLCATLWVMTQFLAWLALFVFPFLLCPRSCWSSPRNFTFFIFFILRWRRKSTWNDIIAILKARSHHFTHKRISNSHGRISLNRGGKSVHKPLFQNHLITFMVHNKSSPSRKPAHFICAT